MLAGDGMDVKTKEGKNYKEALEEGKTTNIGTSNVKNDGTKEKSNGSGTEMTEKKRKGTGNKNKLIKEDLGG